MTRLLVLGLAAALCAGALGCQFDTSPLAFTAKCGVASGQACVQPASQPAVDAGATAAPTAAAPSGVLPPPVVQFDAGAHAQGAMPPLAPIDAGPVRPHPPRLAVDAGPAPAAGDRDATTNKLDDASADAAPADPPGAMFGTCSSTSQCASGLTCSNDPSTTIVGAVGYCMPPCDASGWNGNWDGGAGGTGSGVTCPQPKSGTVVAACQINGMCMLGVCDGQQCPSGLACMPTTLSSGVAPSSCQGTAATTH